MDMTSQSSSDSSYRMIIMLMLVMVALGQVSVDIYLPSFPAMVIALKTTDSNIKLTLTTYLIGVAVSQLFYGPFSDSYGRKRLVILGMSIYLFATFVCWLAYDIQIFLTARLLQGIGAGCCFVLSRAIARDIFTGTKLASVSSLLSLTWGIVPIIAPVIGGFIQDDLGWRANFALLFVGLVICYIMLLLKLPETNKQPQPLLIKTIIANFKQLLGNRSFIGYAICPAMMFGVTVGFNVAGPFLIEDRLGFCPAQYGMLSAIPTFFYLSANIGNIFLVKYFPIKKLINLGVYLNLLSSALFLLLGLLGIFNIYSIIIPWSCIYLVCGICFANCITSALIPFKNIAGAASAIIGCIQILGGIVISSVVSRIHEQTQLPLALVIMTASIIIFCSFHFLANKENTN